MDDKELKIIMDQIPVPKEKVFHAIDRGMARASYKAQSKRKVLLSTVAAAVLLGTTIASGFVNPSMNKVLAKAPFIGQLYQEFGDSLGTNLAGKNLVTKFNKSVLINGVKVEIISAYLDGNVVSVTGHVAGDLDQGGRNEKGEVSFGVNFEHHKGDLDPWLDGMTMALKKKEHGYDFHWKLAYPYKTIKENLTLPISIHNINGIKGDWNFDIPISQKKYKTIVFNPQFQTYQDQGIKLRVSEIKVAQASSSLEFETVSNYKYDDINIYKAVDNLGRTVFDEWNNSTLSVSKEEDGYHKILRKTFSKLDPEITSITFYPLMTLADPAVGQLLDTPFFTIKSKRTDMEIKVNGIKQEGNELIVDYQLLGFSGPLTKNILELYKNNLSYQFELIDKRYLDKIDPDNPVPPENHSISRNKVTVLDEKTAHFQSVFELNGEENIENFRLEDTVLQFNFSSSSQKLEPFSVQISKGK